MLESNSVYDYRYKTTSNQIQICVYMLKYYNIDTVNRTGDMVFQLSFYSKENLCEDHSNGTGSVHQLRRDVQSISWDVQERISEVWPLFGQDYQQIFI